MQLSDIDQSTVKIAVDTTGSTCAVYVAQGGPKEFAHCHLTRGANHSGNGATFGDAVKVTATLDLVLGPDVAQDWSFNFLQFGNLMVREALWGGRTAGEGSVYINFAIPPAFPTNPSLDSTKQFNPWVNLLSSTQAPGSNSRMTLTRVFGDHPNSLQALRMPNATTNCTNYLYNMRLDAGFTTVLVAQDTQGTNHFLAHFTWHVIYDAKFTWQGGTCTGTMANGRLDVGPVKTGKPADPALQALLTKPAAPFYNDLCLAAGKHASTNQKPPVVVESATRDGKIPATFYT